MVLLRGHGALSPFANGLRERLSMSSRLPRDRALGAMDLRFVFLRNARNQFVHPRKKSLEQRRGVGPVVTQNQVDRRSLAMKWANDHRRGQQISGVKRE